MRQRMLTRNKASLSAEAGNIVRALASGSLPNGLAATHVKELPRAPVRGAARPRADAGHWVPRPERTLPRPSGCNGSRERLFACAAYSAETAFRPERTLARFGLEAGHGQEPSFGRLHLMTVE